MFAKVKTLKQLIFKFFIIILLELFTNSLLFKSYFDYLQIHVDSQFLELQGYFFKCIFRKLFFNEHLQIWEACIAKINKILKSTID